MKMGKNFNKFFLLIWKNWLLKRRSPISTLFEITLPILLCLLVCALGLSIRLEHHEEVFYNPLSLKIVSPINTVFWSPCGNPSISKIMRSVAIKRQTALKCFNDSNDLHYALQYYSQEGMVGVQFDDSLASQRDLYKNIRISLRFPEDGRANFSSWSTNTLLPRVQVAGPRDPKANDGGTPFYFKRSFLTLQNDISQEILRFHSNEKILKIQMQRFPYPPWTSYPIHTMIDLIALIILLSFSNLFAHILKNVAIEKETQIKEIMKIMGLTNWLHWIAWFASTLLLSLIPITVMVVLLKVPLFSTSASAVFPKTDSIVLLIFLLLFVSATITCAFAVSVFFSRSQTATTVGGIYFIISYIPYLITGKSSFSAKISACILCNTAFGYGMNIIGTYESLYESLEFSNLFAPISPEDSLSLGSVMMMFIVDIILHILITLYVEAVFPGEYGLPNVWYFPFKKTFWYRTPQKVSQSDITDIHIILEENIYEKEPSNTTIGMRILRLKKKFGKHKMIVRNISFNTFEGQITVLLGHNGAGKTTVMSMLTGILPPSSGTAIINGYDIRTNMNKIRESLGFCPQNNVLFDNLTAQEHFYFFSRLKGMKREEAKKEANEYLHKFDLTAKKKSLTKTLSGGMKRKVCVGIALCGKSKVCIFDEPTSGLDPTARRRLWDVMQRQKQGRTILLSTHFMNEADVLGDRIAIFANGVLQCYGSSFFLKKKYGSGYRLVIVKSRDCDITQITRLLSSYIPNITVETDAGSEITYVLPEERSSIFETMLSDLERASTSLNIHTYGISLASLEEVFMKVGVDCDQEDDEHYFSKSQSNIHGKNYYLHGLALHRNQFLAMLFKKMITTYRAWFLLLIHFLVPICLLIINMHFLNEMKQLSESPKLDFTLNSYYNPIIVITTENVKNSYYEEYKKFLKHENRQYIDWGRENMKERMLKESTENITKVRTRYIMGATFSNSTITAWFNNEYFHTAPLALQYAINSVVKSIIGSNYSIRFSNHPAPHVVNTPVQSTADTSDGIVKTIAIGLCMCYISPYFAMFYVRERVCKSKHLQLVSGTTIIAFWLMAFVWDFIIFFCMSICIVLVLICFQTALNFGSLMVLFLIFGFAMLPMIYLISFLYKRPSSAYSGINLICFFLGVLAFLIIYFALAALIENVYRILHDIFLFMPHYALISGVYNISTTFSTIKKCALVDKLYQDLHKGTNTASNNYACKLIPDPCCDTDYYSLRNGIGRHITYLAIFGAIAFLILFVYEYRICDCLLYTFASKTPPTLETQDDDVLEEKRKVQMGEIEHMEYKVVLKNMTKYFKHFLAVNQLCLGVKEYECFGLLGVNGAGKTTTFKMLTGEEKLSYGNAWISGLSLRRNVKKIHKRIGYCPQFDALLEDLTGRETLIMYCLLRGVPIKDSNRISKQLAHEFQFYKHLNKKVKNYSGGTKRKLTTAIALIGEPPILFLDEPSTGMDPGTKRYLWNILCRIRDNGKCIILVTHNIEECEAICTRVAIMVNGEFQCLGSPQHLKSKFSDGYILIIKLKKSALVNPEIDYLKEIDKFVNKNFSNAEVKDSHESLVTYVIKDMSRSWSRIFGIMENAKKRIQIIEDYSLSQFDLEQIFLHFTKSQEFN